MKLSPSIFKDYDIRATDGESIDDAGVFRIGEALGHFFKPKKVSIGRDMRLSSDRWFKLLSDALINQGINVIDLGLISTDMSYFAAGTLDADISIMITASHNPSKDNGMKIVKKGAIGVSGDSGIYDIRDLALSNEAFATTTPLGTITKLDILEKWVTHALKFVNVDELKPLKVVIDAGNGMAGKFIPAIEKYLPINIIPMFFELDGSFPNHLANPLLTEAQTPIVEKVREMDADLGIIFDGDGDRMFLVDDKGKFLSGTITTAMVASRLLKRNPGSTILYNAICGRVVPETVEKSGGKSVRVRVGHTLIKEAMRKHDALFAGEHSGHYYFRENFSADSGLIAALVVLELISVSNKKLSEIAEIYDVYPSSGEINFSVPDKKAMMESFAEKYSDSKIDWLDGLSIWKDDWWANIRPSNTQPVLRLNVEADNADLLKTITAELQQHIINTGGKIAEEH